MFLVFALAHATTIDVVAPIERRVSRPIANTAYLARPGAHARLALHQTHAWGVRDRTSTGSLTGLAVTPHFAMPWEFVEATGDVDGDGFDEVVVRTDDVVSVYTQQGTRLAHLVTGYTSSLALRLEDVDGDGILELITGGRNPTVSLTVWDLVTETALWSVPLPSTSSWGAAPWDGRPGAEVIVDETVYDGRTGAVVGDLGVGRSTRLSDHRAADLDGDGDLELIWFSNSRWVVHDPSVADDLWYLSAGGPHATAMWVGDLDGDGASEVVGSRPLEIRDGATGVVWAGWDGTQGNCNDVGAYRTDTGAWEVGCVGGRDRFTLDGQPIVDPATYGGTPRRIDLDRDGVDEVLLLGPTLTVLDASGAVLDALTLDETLTYAALADTDGDGLEELVTTLGDVRSWTWDRVQGFVRDQLLAPTGQASFHTPVVADIDADGVLDVLYGYPVRRLDLASGGDAELLPFGVYTAYLDVADLDGDGVPELVSCSDGWLELYDPSGTLLAERAAWSADVEGGAVFTQEAGELVRLVWDGASLTERGRWQPPGLAGGIRLEGGRVWYSDAQHLHAWRPGHEVRFATPAAVLHDPVLLNGELWLGGQGVFERWALP